MQASNEGYGPIGVLARRSHLTRDPCTPARCVDEPTRAKTGRPAVDVRFYLPRPVRVATQSHLEDAAHERRSGLDRATGERRFQGMPGHVPGGASVVEQVVSLAQLRGAPGHANPGALLQVRSASFCGELKSVQLGERLGAEMLADLEARLTLAFEDGHAPAEGAQRDGGRATCGTGAYDDRIEHRKAHVQSWSNAAMRVRLWRIGGFSFVVEILNRTIGRHDLAQKPHFHPACRRFERAIGYGHELPEFHAVQFGHSQLRAAESLATQVRCRTGDAADGPSPYTS